VTFIQRFGDALDLNPHFHSLMLDSADVVRHGRSAGLVEIKAPSDHDARGHRGAGSDPRGANAAAARRRGKVEDDEVAGVEDDGSMLSPCMAASVQRVGVMAKARGSVATTGPLNPHHLAPSRRRSLSCSRTRSSSSSPDVRLRRG